MTDLPITVSGSALRTIATSLIRHGLTALGGILVAKGFLSQTVADQATDQALGLILTIAPALWGAWKAKHTNSKLVVLADLLPDPVASVNRGTS